MQVFIEGCFKSRYRMLIALFELIYSCLWS